jgi:hypothetical protein
LKEVSLGFCPTIKFPVFASLTNQMPDNKEAFFFVIYADTHDARQT